MNTDCIYHVDKWEDNPRYHVCKYSGTLYESGVEDNTMCQHCRLWDSYIPQTASDAQKENAIKWQNMPADEQPSYEEYFNVEL